MHSFLGIFYEVGKLSVSGIFLASSEPHLHFWGPGGTPRVACFADSGKDARILHILRVWLVVGPR